MKRKKATKSVVVARPAAMTKLTVGGIALLVVAIGLSIAVAKGVFSSSTPNVAAMSSDVGTNSAATTSSSSTFERRDAGLQAISQAAAENKYLFAFFWSHDNDQAAAMKRVFEDATAKVADRAVTVSVCVSDPTESGIVKKYDLERAPMPLVLAIAPNGAVMGGFPTKCEEQELLNAFSSPGTEKCMKALQEDKLVFLCVQNDATTSNREALQGVQDFRADERYASATEIVVLDPRDPAEASFLGDLKIDTQTTTAVTAFLAPPGPVIAEYQGATTKEQLIAALQKSNAGPADKRTIRAASSPLMSEGAGQGLETMSRAAAEGKYLFAFFWRSDDGQTAAMRKVFEDATAKVAQRAMAVSVRMGDPGDSGIVRKYDLERAPMPLLLAIAPNGAITGGFPTKFEERDLLSAFASPGAEKCLKALQEGKLVLLCVQNDWTTSNREALQGVEDFTADERYANATEVVVLDPRDEAEASFLGNLKIDPQSTTAVTALLVPPSSVIAEYRGATTKEQLIAAVQKAKTR